MPALAFFAWYNTAHRHSGIGYMTPHSVHYGHAQALHGDRQATLDAAFLARPTRFTSKKINDAFFRYNLMEQWNRSVRVGATQAVLRFLARHSQGESKHSERWLAELGLTAADVKLDADGKVSNIADSKIINAVNRWVDGAELRPDAGDRPIWMNDPHWALVAHLKQFVYTFQHTIIDRVKHEVDHGNYAPAMAMAGYVPVMIAADALKAGLTDWDDDDPRQQWGPSDYVWSGVQRAGLLGVGQFEHDLTHNPWSLTGPTIEQLADGWKVVHGDKQFSDFALRSLPANALYRDGLD